MPTTQDEIRVAAVNGDKNPLIMVNGKEVIVSSATDQPKHSMWLAWLVIRPSRPEIQADNPFSGT